jgi:formate dehydrogenase subunit delta
MMSPVDRLAYMVNQIARNLAAKGPEEAALAVADHIAAFWDPHMKRRLLDMDETKLAPIAVRAVHLLSSRGAPVPQSAATSFGSGSAGGGSDAG